jgi:hypothetical protein
MMTSFQVLYLCCQFQPAPLHCGAADARHARHSKAVHVEANETHIESAGFQPLKLACDETLSNFAFN